jgi:hypothetical protein
MQNTAKTASYKGHTYRVLYIGPTKYGQRARLQFFDGSKDFWCDASLVSVSSSTPTGSRYSRHERNDGMVRCRHCHQLTREGDDWCDRCGKANYE